MWPRADSRLGDHDLARRSDQGSRQTAVIDVGSNSVRLVIYRIEGRSIWTIFNEKALAGLGRNLPATGRLSPEGVETAIAALRRFRVALSGWDHADIVAVATAAVREASDGPQFLARVESETGFRLRVLSGAEEARYAALGVIAGQPDWAAPTNSASSAASENRARRPRTPTRSKRCTSRKRWEP